jgi:hypothetical protein
MRYCYPSLPVEAPWRTHVAENSVGRTHTAFPWYKFFYLARRRSCPVTHVITGNPWFRFFMQPNRNSNLMPIYFGVKQGFNPFWFANPTYKHPQSLAP